MIAHLSGKLFSKEPNRLVIDVNGVGYDVTIPLSTFYEIGEIGSPIQLLVHTYVREDAILLFGFKTPEERQLFEQLTSVSGIGPKLGISILSGMSVSELVPAIRQSNLARLTTIPGVGKKTAERLVVDLRDKVARIGVGADSQGPPATRSAQEEDVISALVNLGYPKPQAERALQKALTQTGEAHSFEELLRNSLRQLAK
ncbi:MAG TPA: Holliday junction branch migration protein RuvA [Terriglobia bacterium]|nr:Holliday junction branch migration protein RuvA [Terriglobia bacterium]